jgi:hypothetical protein
VNSVPELLAGFTLYCLLFPILLNQGGQGATHAFNVITLLNETMLIISQTALEKLFVT